MTNLDSNIQFRNHLAVKNYMRKDEDDYFSETGVEK